MSPHAATQLVEALPTATSFTAAVALLAGLLVLFCIAELRTFNNRKVIRE